MKIKILLPFVFTLAISICVSAHAGEEPQAPNADYETAEKAAERTAALASSLRTLPVNDSTAGISV